MSDVDCGDGDIAGGRGREEVGEVVVGVDNDGEAGSKRGEGELDRGELDRDEVDRDEVDRDDLDRDEVDRGELDRGELDRDEVDRGERCMSTCPGPTQLTLSSST
jgi:hypothetical protein